MITSIMVDTNKNNLKPIHNLKKLKKLLNIFSPIIVYVKMIFLLTIYLLKEKIYDKIKL